MDVETVKRWVAEIEAISGDDEAAHLEEDRLYKAVLAHIADQGGLHADLAEAALEAEKISFARWCA